MVVGLQRCFRIVVVTFDSGGGGGERLEMRCSKSEEMMREE